MKVLEIDYGGLTLASSISVTTCGLMTAQCLQQVRGALLIFSQFAHLSFQEHSAPPINTNKVELLHSFYVPYHSIFERLPPYPEGFDLDILPL